MAKVLYYARHCLSPMEDNAGIFVNVELLQKPKGVGLHLTGGPGNGHSRTSFVPVLAALLPEQLAPGWTGAMRDRLLEIWLRWNLNYQKVECEHMAAFRGLGIETPYGETCPECGYRLGITYYHEPLLEEVIDFLKSMPGKVEVYSRHGPRRSLPAQRSHGKRPFLHPSPLG